MDNEIDVDLHDPILWQGVVSQLQHENERLRGHILKMRTARNPMEAVNLDAMRTWLTKNYFVIVAIGFMLMVALSFFDTARGLFNKKRSQTSEG